jgi:hypothetical protein
MKDKTMRTTVALLALSLLVVAGCGVESRVTASQDNAILARATTASAVPGVDPCGLVTPTDMATMFGELKEGPLPSSGLRDERQCNYTNLSGSWIKLSLAAGQERWEWEKGITNAQNPREIGGLGDEAFAIRRGTDSVVYVRKGEAILELSCSCDAAVAEAIARVATSRL